MHDANARREPSNLLIFLPLALVGVFFVYLVTTIPFKMGREQGLVEAAYFVPKKDDSAATEVFDHQKLVKPSPDAIQLGAKLFATQCASCHGAEGLGNGAAGQRLVVKPRNFHDAGIWKNGASAVQMYQSLEKGVGGNMPAFPSLNPKQKYAVIHYIHDEFMKTVGYPETTAAELASLPAPAAGGTEIKIDAYAETRMPVRYAMMKMAEPMPKPAADVREANKLLEGLGKDLYTANCMACHGPSGEGMVPEKVMTLTQLRELAWGSSLLGKNEAWASDYEAFRSIVVNGQPEGIKPGFPTLTEDELRALYNHTRALRGAKE